MNIQTMDRVVDISIPTTVKHIGVMLSGGMDSTILLFLILKEIQDNKINVSLTAFIVPVDRLNAKEHAYRVINFLENYFQIKINVQVIGSGSLPHDLNIKVPSRLILHQKLVDKLYVGINQNPPVDFGVPQINRRHPDAPIPETVGFPFVKLYKTHILKLYQIFNVLELAHMTHSCGSSADSPCKECFHCFERSWAFTELNLKEI
jgi:hypothetical protein